MHKNHILVAILQLVRSRAAEAGSKVIIFKDFPGAMDQVLDGLGLRSHLGRCWGPMCWILKSGGGLSCAKIWGSWEWGQLLPLYGIMVFFQAETCPK